MVWEDSGMQKNLEKKVLAYCSKHRMLQEGDHVVLGVSGGADSVCLLFVLLAMSETMDLHLHVVHVNHGIRPDAGKDAAYVKALCEANQIPFYQVEENVGALAKAWGLSEEEAGRKVRYDAFDRVLKEQNAHKIAVAHNANDRAETMLFHMFRGTGLTGLAGIRPVRENVIRPLLCLDRREIENYLQEKQIRYCHDCTNDSDEYTRNKIRHHILEYAQRNVVSGCVGNMNRTADILTETENYIEEQANAARETCVIGRKSSFEVDCEAFSKLHNVIQKRVLLQLLKELSPEHKDIGAIHVEDIQSLFLRTGNRCIHLPYGIRGRREYNLVILDRDVVQNEVNEWSPAEVDLSVVKEYGELYIALGQGKRLIFEYLDCAGQGINCKNIPQNQYTKWFDYDKIKECLTIRTRKPGDFLYIKDSNGEHCKKLKDYMICEKIPQRQREQIPLLTEGNHVLWIMGYRISEHHKVSENTKAVLQVSYEQNNRTAEQMENKKG